MTKKLTQDEFIERARAKHGDRYDYSQTVYTATREPIDVICSEHGLFRINRANDHLHGTGCVRCVYDKLTDTKDGFVRKARETHGDRYDYSLAEYKNALTPVKIICSIHSTWKQRPAQHVRGHGCPECGHGVASAKRSMRLNDFIARANEVHSNKYSYEKAEYRPKSNGKVLITCPDHGDFWQDSGNHLQGHGCMRCKADLVSEAQRSNTEDFIARAKIIHNDLYDYSLTKYGANQKEPVIIICPEHGAYTQVPNYHLNGNGCPDCNSRSQGETAIAEYLDKWGIKYQKEAKFPECKNKRALPFDFQIFTDDSFFLLEYHGIHHYKPVTRWGGQKSLERRQRIDALKEKWARDNGIGLFVIPYWEKKNLQAVLLETIKKAGLSPRPF